MNSKALSRITLSVTLSLAPGATLATQQIFMKMTGVTGSATDRRHAGEIVVTAFSLGASAQTAPAFGGGGGAGRISCTEVRVTKPIDVSSTQLLSRLFRGTHIDQTIISVEQNTDRPYDSYTVELDNSLITNIQQSEIATLPGAPPSITLPTAPIETISLQPTIYKYTFYTQNADGAISQATFGWDCRTNRPIPSTAP
jgi:type VI secretion system secreted protein Hcp